MASEFCGELRKKRGVTCPCSSVTYSADNIQGQRRVCAPAKLGYNLPGNPLAWKRHVPFKLSPSTATRPETALNRDRQTLVARIHKYIENATN